MHGVEPIVWVKFKWSRRNAFTSCLEFKKQSYMEQHIHKVFGHSPQNFANFSQNSLISPQNMTTPVYIH